MKVNGYRFPIWLILFVATSFLLAILSLYMVAQVMAAAPDFASNPVEFSHDIYFPADSEHCSGDILTTDFKFRVLHERAVMTLVETWANDDGITIVQDETPQYVITEKNPEWRVFTLEKEIPDFAPGHYSFLVAVFTSPSARHPAFFEVPFTVVDCE